MFFDIYRTAAFDTVPRDDYASYLLSLVGQNYKAPGAPFAYRILSVIVAIPFYYFLPTYTFTNLSNVDIAYLKATQALSFTSYLSLVLTAVTIYLIARKQFQTTRISSFVVGLVSFFLSDFISKVGIDPFAILIISLLFLFLDRPFIFVPFVFLSIGINEKIPIIFATILAFRLINSLTQRYQYNLYLQLFSSCLAVAGYIAITLNLKLPGNEGQTDPALFVSHFQSSISYTFSLKGLFLNALPILILGLIIVLAIKPQQQLSFHVSDVSALFILIILTMIADVVYNIGRIAMYSYPLYLPAVAYFIDDTLDLKSVSHGKS
jgi:preprotein translocase subunit Sec61beta